MSAAAELNFLARPGGPLRGRIRVPGDKSVSHRAIMLSSLAEGVSRVDGFLEGEDTLATAAAFAAMGVRIESPAPNRRIVHGVGLHGLREPADAIDCGNAGTGMRLLAGLLSAQQFDSVLVGDASLSRRPMGRVIDPLQLMGGRIDSEQGRPPLHIHGGRTLSGIAYSLPVASAQVKSALLLAGLYAEGTTRISEPHPTRDYTERMLRNLGARIEFGEGWATLVGGTGLKARDVEIPSDFSSAAFFLVAASLIPGSELCIEAVGMNPRRTGLLHALRAMGADIVEIDAREAGGEPVADLLVRHAPLRGIEIDPSWVPDMIDEFPVLFVAAALSSGQTVVRGAAELRVKESDRIAVMSRALRESGVEIEEHPDGAVITGRSELAGAEVDSAGDHRCAMAMAVAAQRARSAITIRDCANVATSFPGFVELAAGAGFGLSAATAGQGGPRSQ